ncbi:hypothetical protein [Sphingomonas crusticola]|uniref:hypothetical protein n=1 Tax=Sphingomonas crusticola TaxID=1697973 RepID=UPI000E24E688|nr:hypothetical protein [Sphingomonas crusticola]
MWSKLIWTVAAVLAAAVLAVLGERTIAAYGEARYHAGLADGQMRQFPEVLASHVAAAQIALEGRDRIIDADARHAAELTRISTLARRSDQELYSYAATAAGGADCLDAERVRHIEAGRAALFVQPGSAPRDEPGPVPADSLTEGNNRRNE